VEASRSKNQIRAHLWRRGVTAREAARAVGISPGYLSRLTSGQRQPSLAVADRLAEFLGCSVTDLWPWLH